ncbi:GlxA family transcriptional regulator [Niabella drilacis]|uniref:Transcriptional regulator GlxA family, contains an amidase domain and an AraC-type DNA-binding HTH domain n=1 Tax=Niabella drilacis (strain DSM 25811 / CCM 8410 / CCUG 62505 / LMG 26954 / E90) TaxID=1285928 RepID=A0A1G6T6H8_NIADE|nr:helix-turn-helix domain-containing protein [Niabella drilacis]SDD24484.1 Transcriptional regulator GlxA family, contains an amidase domain and an AraC-type DNA-binding HTH domain [Niabella drilacis]
MKKVVILLLKGANLSSIENPRQGFEEANRYLQASGRSALFEIQLAAAEPRVQLNNGLYEVQAHRLVHETDQADLILVPALQEPIAAHILENQAIIPWLQEQHRCGAEIASLCMGAFLLAGTGLLNNRSCVTHWKASNEFSKLFPEVNLVADKILTDEGGVYTSSGGFSASNLVLYLIEKYAGREVAVYCSKYFQIDIQRSSQSPFIIFSGMKDHGDETIKEAQDYIEQNFDERLPVDTLCERFSVGRRTFERRFKKATTNTVVEYIQKVKIEAAKKLLEQGRRTIQEAMYHVGYNDVKAFRDVFKKITGMTPVDYKLKYEKILV